MNPTGAQIASVSDTRTDTARTHGCTEWDNGGIRAALMATTGNTADVMAAAHLAAGDPSLQYPSERGFLVHWPKNSSGDRPAMRWTPCGEHPAEEAASCRFHGGDYDPAQGMALVMAELAKSGVKPATRRGKPAYTPDETHRAEVRARIDQEAQR